MFLSFSLDLVMKTDDLSRTYKASTCRNFVNFNEFT